MRGKRVEMFKAKMQNWQCWRRLRLRLGASELFAWRKAEDNQIFNSDISKWNRMVSFLCIYFEFQNFHQPCFTVELFFS